MTIQRMDHVGVVVDDLEAAISFFVELGMELDGRKTPLEGDWVDRVVGLDEVRVEIAFVRTPDGYGRLELTKFHNPPATTAEPNAPANTFGLRRIMFAVDELHESRGKTRNARRPINLDPTTVAVLRAWHAWQSTEQHAVGIADHGWVFTDNSGHPVHPHAISQAFERLATRALLPVIRLHDVRHTHATLLIRAGVPAKVVSERLGHATAAFTIETDQHVMPGMQADAATVIETLSALTAMTFYRHRLLPAQPA